MLDSLERWQLRPEQKAPALSFLYLLRVVLQIRLAARRAFGYRRAYWRYLGRLMLRWGLNPQKRQPWLRACALRSPLHPLCAASCRDSGSQRPPRNSASATRKCYPVGRIGWRSAECGTDKRCAGTFVARSADSGFPGHSGIFSPHVAHSTSQHRATFIFHLGRTFHRGALQWLWFYFYLEVPHDPRERFRHVRPGVCLLRVEAEVRRAVEKSPVAEAQRKVRSRRFAPIEAGSIKNRSWV